MKNTRLVRAVYFNCIHKYEVAGWTDEKNRETFGDCFHPVGHGHTYRLEVYLQGQADEQTGMVINLKDLDVLLAKVLEPIKDKHLNFELEEFKSKVPTTENIANYLYKRLEQELRDLPLVLIKLRLFENDDLWVDCVNDQTEIGLS